MFPWDHLVIGYLGASLYARLRGRRLGEAAVVAVGVGSQFPDLVDKPLAWTFGVLPSGTTLAHSVFVALPVSAAAAVVGRRLGHPAAGVAFAVSYLLHLPADLVYGPIVFGKSIEFGGLLWPLVSVPASEPAGLVETARYYIARLYIDLRTPRALAFVALEAALLGAGLAVWIADGTPGRRSVRAVYRRVVS